MPRLREYITNAMRQRAYRERKKQQHQTIHELLVRLERALAPTPLAAPDPITTLTNLVNYLEQARGLPQTTRSLLAQIEHNLAEQSKLINILTEEIQQCP